MGIEHIEPFSCLSFQKAWQLSLDQESPADNAAASQLRPASTLLSVQGLHWKSSVHLNSEEPQSQCHLGGLLSQGESL